MTDREIMQQALEALEMHVLGFDGVRKMELAIEALEAALAQPDETETLKRCLFQMQEAAKALTQPEQEPVQEPVAWRNAAIRLGEDLYSVGPNGYYDMTAKQWLDWALSVVNTDPPKREWVGLTDDEIKKIMQRWRNGYIDIKDVEKLLKDKNT